MADSDGNHSVNYLILTMLLLLLLLLKRSQGTRRTSLVCIYRARCDLGPVKRWYIPLLLFRAAQRRKYDAVEAIPQQQQQAQWHSSSHRISLVTIKGYCPKALLCCCSARKQQQQPLLLFKLLLGGFWKGIEQDGEEMFVMVYVVKQQSYSFPPFLWGSRICNTVVVKRHNTDC